MGNKIAFKLRRLAALLLALLMIAGCGVDPSVPTEPTTPTTAPTDPIQPTNPTQPPDPTQPTEPEQPIEPEPLPELEAVTYLNCVELDVFPELLSLGNGLVVASRNTYSDLQGRINETFIIDIYQDEVVAKSVRAHSMELVTQKFADGAIVLAEPDSGKFFVFDQNLTAKSSFVAPNLDGFFSYDRSDYYYLLNDKLYCMKVADGKTAPVNLDVGLRFESLVDIHPSKDVLVTRVYLDSETTDYGVAVVDVKTGKILLLRDDLTHVWLTGDRFSGVETNPKNLSFDVYFGSLTGGDIQRIPTDQIYSGSVSYSVLPGSEYMVWRLNPDNGDKATKIYDLNADSAVADMGEYEFSTALFSPVYLPHEQVIMGYYSIKEEKTPENPYPKESFRFVLINPAKLTYTEGAKPEECSWQNPVDLDAVAYA